MSVTTDLSLFALLRTTEHEVAISGLFDRYSKLVYSIAFKILRDSGAAEDLTQELFLSIWTRPPVLSSQSESLTRWFMVTARNRAISALRTRKPEDPIEEATILSCCDSSTRMEGSFALGRITQAMETLSAVQKATLESAFFEGLTHKQIAAQTGDALGTVKTRIRTALKLVSAACQQVAHPVQKC